MATSLEPDDVLSFPLHPTNAMFLKCEPYLLEFFMNKSYCSLKLLWEVPIIEEEGLRRTGPASAKSIKMIYNPMTYHEQDLNIDPDGNVVTDSANYRVCDIDDHRQIYRVLKEYCRREGPPGPRIKRVIEFTSTGVREVRIPGSSADFCDLPIPGLDGIEVNRGEDIKEVRSYIEKE